MLQISAVENSIKYLSNIYLNQNEVPISNLETTGAYNNEYGTPPPLAWCEFADI